MPMTDNPLRVGGGESGRENEREKRKVTVSEGLWLCAPCARLSTQMVPENKLEESESLHSPSDRCLYVGELDVFT